MSLDLALSVARSGLRLLDRQMARAADDIANAGTEGHTRKLLAGDSLHAAGMGLGVRQRVATRDVDVALVAAADRARGEGAAAALVERLLGGVEAAHGRPEDGDSLAGRLAGLRSAFVLLRESPADANARASALQAAGDLAAGFNGVAGAIGTARQAAQDAMVDEVAAINVGLNRVAELNIGIRREFAAGRSTAALEDQRDVAIGRLSESLDLTVIHQPGGAVALVARGGMVLPLDPVAPALSMAEATVGAGAFHGGAGTLPGVLLGGQDVTRRVVGGRLAAAATLRDETLPRMQAEADLAAAHVAQRFAAQGLAVFDDGAGVVPDTTLPYAGSAQLGFAGAMRVSAAVAADATLLRDGTAAVVAVPGGPTAFTPNPPGGPAGFATMIDRVLDHVFGGTLAPGVAHAAVATTGLGPNGQLGSTLSGLVTLEDYAAALVAEQTAQRAQAGEARGRAESLREVLGARIAERSGVDVDEEVAAMVQLQTAYGVNARVIATAQAMWDALFGAVR
jgi:flagellar hook-associated protein 1 FlgK